MYGFSHSELMKMPWRTFQMYYVYIGTMDKNTKEAVRMNKWRKSARQRLGLK